MSAPNATIAPVVEQYVVTFVNERLYAIIQYAIFYGIWPCVIIIGIITNIINILVFVTMGVKDSMMASFLALSTTDLAYLLCSSLPASATVIGLSGTTRSMPINAFFLAGIAVYYQGLFLDISLGIIAYVAIAKCCCVVIALKFKSVFTLKRTFIVLTIIVITALTSRLPVFTSMGLIWVSNPQTNRSQLVGWFSKDFKSSVEFNNLLNRTAYPNAIFVIVLICSVILSSSLVEASAMRLKMTSGNKRKPEIKKSSHDYEEDHGDKNILTKRDLHVIRQVVTVACCLMFTVMILSLNSLAAVFIPGFNSTGKYWQLYNITETIGYTCTHIHAGVHLVIYLRFNLKFKLTCSKIFSLTSSLG
ncbi:uncharacterized protein LOC131949644 [Physella acuta]|uniref:uncharacterized protein LOC131949644 n=1 Tax=Physella acuta TaxID=109671 RepID=UPI0027DC3D44|nr:uncharacterized protein LOC131949644 [Physella acuta]